MGKRYLVDTNIAIYLLNGVLPDNAKAFLRPILDVECNLSIVAKIELLGWQFANANDEAKATSLVADSLVLPLSDSIAEKTIELRKIKKLKLGDAIIASTAMVYDMTLLTRNSTDCSGLTGLEFVNPFDV